MSAAGESAGRTRAYARGDRWPPDPLPLDGDRFLAGAEELYLERATSAGEHPVVTLSTRLIDFLGRLGFTWCPSSEIDDVTYTFDLLGVPEKHLIRGSSHTFLLDDGRLLRSHTTSSVLRVLDTEPGRVERRVVVGGPCYRSVRPGPRFVTFFHQVEMCAVGPDVGLSDVKGLALATVDEVLGAEPRLRFRALPYVAPGIAVDVACTPCDGAGCVLCGGRGQLEVMAGGVLRDEIAAAVRVPTSSRVGLLAVSLERVLALRHGVPDIRPFVSSDPRALASFG